MLNKVDGEVFTKDVTFEQGPRKREGRRLVDISVWWYLFLICFTFVSIHQKEKLLVICVIRRQEGPASDEDD